MEETWEQVFLSITVFKVQIKSRENEGHSLITLFDFQITAYIIGFLPSSEPAVFLKWVLARKLNQTLFLNTSFHFGSAA